MSGVAHVVLEGDGLFCRHCGKRETLFPMRLTEKRIKAMQLIGESFEEEHATCQETGASPSKAGVRDPHAWRRGGDTGQSSITVWSVAMGRSSATYRASTPFDPSDFGRCHRLLEAFPWMRPKLAEVAERHPKWAPLVREWDRLTALYLRDLPTGACQELYEEMQRLNAEGEI